MENWTRHLAMARYLAAIMAAGYDVKVCTDFERIPDLALLSGRDFQMPQFDIGRTDLTAGRAFWLFLIHRGEAVGGAAVQLQDLGGEPLDRYLLRTASHQFPRQDGPTLKSVAQPLSAITGRIAYIGELRFATGHRGRREVLQNFMRLLQCMAVVEWRVAWSYAFIPERHMRARLDLVYGFTRALPSAQVWASPVPAVRSSSEWFVGASREELDHIFSLDAKVL
ncbi:hypothetical protein [Salipiger bermudensis]|uniref:hypothetical protein n=1 Tax=Salipiger bermudensis TaxID=344736 RepID=UPI001CD7BEC7|nr:hypothetical protein [Salipiger bermudensis]MCA0963305.1 hypothetical protein [Salipiger bermudensis]